MSDNAPVVDGQGGAAPAAAPAAAAPAAAPNTPAIAWLPDADELTTGYIQNKGWQSPADLLKSYQGAEKLIGVPPDKVLRLPSETSTKEDLDAFYSKLGRPADPKGYELKAPDGVDPSFLNAATEKFHELGLNTKQAQELSKWYESQGTSMTEAQQQAKTTANVEQQNALRTEWGAAYDAKLTQARAFAQQAGVDAATLDKLQDAMGFDGVMKFMANLGGKIGEANFVSGDRTTQFGVMTPAQAQAEIKSLTTDKDFRSKYLAGNAEAKARMAQLNKWAFPE
jgi:hypothetical protein